MNSSGYFTNYKVLGFRTSVLTIMVLLAEIALFVSKVTGESHYQFIAYPVSKQDGINELGIDLGYPRIHPDGNYRLTNRNGNLPFSSSELELLEILDSVQIIDSDSIGVYLESNGWDEGGVQ